MPSGAQSTMLRRCPDGVPLACIHTVVCRSSNHDFSLRLRHQCTVTGTPSASHPQHITVATHLHTSTYPHLHLITHRITSHHRPEIVLAVKQINVISKVSKVPRPARLTCVANANAMRNAWLCSVRCVLCAVRCAQLVCIRWTCSLPPDAMTSSRGAAKVQTWRK